MLPIDFMRFLNKHKNVKVSECKLILCEEIPFIGGSPDTIIERGCCGKACLEIKCPFSIHHFTPCSPEANPSYINRESNALTPKKAHKSFNQCQIQMIAAKATKAIFCLDSSWLYHVLTLAPGDTNNLQQCNRRSSFIWKSRSAKTSSPYSKNLYSLLSLQIYLSDVLPP